jgi:hypothetical protein
MHNWIANFWRDIKGNLKYDLLKTAFQAIGGGGMIAAAGFIIHRIAGIDRVWIEFSAIFVFSALLFVIGTGRPNRTEPAITERELARAQKEAVNNLDSFGRIAIEVLEAYVGWKTPRELIMDELFLLFKLRITPTSEVAAKIKNWAVNFCQYQEMHRTWWTEANIIDIPTGLICKPLGPHHMSGLSIPGGVTPSITDYTYQNAIGFGDSKDGFLLIRIYQDRIEPTFHQSFQISITDVLGVDSGFRIQPGAWLKLAEFSIPPHVVHGVAPATQEIPQPRELLGARLIPPE